MVYVYMYVDILNYDPDIDIGSSGITRTRLQNGISSWLLLQDPRKTQLQLPSIRTYIKLQRGTTKLAPMYKTKCIKQNAQIIVHNVVGRDSRPVVLNIQIGTPQPMHILVSGSGFSWERVVE